MTSQYYHYHMINETPVFLDRTRPNKLYKCVKTLVKFSECLLHNCDSKNILSTNREIFIYWSWNITVLLLWQSPLEPQNTSDKLEQGQGTSGGCPVQSGIGTCELQDWEGFCELEFFQERYSCKCSIGLGLWSWRQGQGLCVRFSEQFLSSFGGLVRHIVSLYHQGAKKGVLNQQRC